MLVIRFANSRIDSIFHLIGQNVALFLEVVRKRVILRGVNFMVSPMTESLEKFNHSVKFLGMLRERND